MKPMTANLLIAGKEMIKDNLDYINQKMSSSIEMKSTDVGFSMLNQIIYSLDKKKYTENRFPTKDKNVYLLINNADYWITYKTKKDFIHVKNTEAMFNVRGAGWIDTKILNIHIYGTNQKAIRKMILKKIQEDKPPKGKIYLEGMFGDRTELEETNFQNVILEKEKQRKIITSLYQWYKDKEWYKNHHMVHKMGILLYGTPGTGKSTLIRAISSMFGRANIYMVYPSGMDGVIDFLREMRRRTTGVMIVVIEDIDFAMKKRENVPQLIQNEQNLDQMVLFQILDGAYSLDETIIIATTNYKEQLDPALIRHGRFDLQIEMTKFDKTRAFQFVNLFGYGRKELEIMMADLDYPVSPATLQAKVLEYRAMNRGEE